ncbi:hypothetical protein N308_03567, partial [Struthio camelus australis]
RANVYPTREYLARGLGEGVPKGCRHCPAEWETCAHIISYCPAVQDARIRRHNVLCGLLAEEAKKLGWEIFIEPHLRGQDNEFLKPDLIVVKEGRARVVDVTVRFESNLSTLGDAAGEKVRKYQHLDEQVRSLTRAGEVQFLGFPLGARGKWYAGNDTLLADLGLSGSRMKKIARLFSRRALLSSVDILHIFASKGKMC